jgi:thiol-disulfide isomerase/thioredoxin
MRKWMMTLTLGAAAAAVAAISLGAQAPVAADQPTTPSACLKATKDFQAGRMKAMAPLDAEKYAGIQKEKATFAASCLAKLAVDAVPPAELTPLAELYIEAGEAAKADATIAKAVAAQTDPALKAKAVNAAINMVLRQPVSDERNARAEKLVDELETLPASFVKERIEGHGRINSYYRADDIDAGIIKHSNRIIELNKKLTPADRVAPIDRTLVAAYVNLAEALAGQEQNPKALDALRRAPAELEGIKDVEGQVKEVLARYELVGKPGAAIEAPQWLNVPAGTKTLDMKGQVTWLQFTAHWCGPCRESYPSVVKMLNQYGTKGFRVVMVTQLYGYFEKQRNLAPADEIAALKTYFPLHGLTTPLAIGPYAMVPSDAPVAPGTAPKMIRKIDPNDANYKVSGIPQIQLIDKKGNIRLIMIGYDTANDARMADLVGRLLAEK